MSSALWSISRRLASKEASPSTLASFFAQWGEYTRRIGVPSSTALSSAVLAYGSQKAWHVVLSLWRAWPHVPLRAAACKQVLHAARRVGDVESSLQVLSAMRDAGYEPSRSDYEFLLTTCLRGEDWSRADAVMEVLADMPGVTSPAVHRALITAAIETGDWSRAAMGWVALASSQRGLDHTQDGALAERMLAAAVHAREEAGARFALAMLDRAHSLPDIGTFQWLLARAAAAGMSELVADLCSLARRARPPAPLHGEQDVDDSAESTSSASEDTLEIHSQLSKSRADALLQAVHSCAGGDMLPVEQLTPDAEVLGRYAPAWGAGLGLPATPAMASAHLAAVGKAQTEAAVAELLDQYLRQGVAPSRAAMPVLTGVVAKLTQDSAGAWMAWYARAVLDVADQVEFMKASTCWTSAVAQVLGATCAPLAALHVASSTLQHAVVWQVVPAELVAAARMTGAALQAGQPVMPVWERARLAEPDARAVQAAVHDALRLCADPARSVAQQLGWSDAGLPAEQCAAIDVAAQQGQSWENDATCVQAIAAASLCKLPTPELVGAVVHALCGPAASGTSALQLIAAARLMPALDATASGPAWGCLASACARAGAIHAALDILTALTVAPANQASPHQASIHELARARGLPQFAPRAAAPAVGRHTDGTHLGAAVCPVLPAAAYEQVAAALLDCGEVTLAAHSLLPRLQSVAGYTPSHALRFVQQAWPQMLRE